MGKKLKAVVIGAAHVHILEVCAYCNENEDIELAAVADTEPILPHELENDKPYTRRWNLEFVKKYGVKVYGDYIEMLDKEKPDLALITTENVKHAEVYEQCAIRGITASVEKPFACNLAEALKMARLAEQNNAEIYVNWPIAWRLWLYQMKDVLDSGRVGKLIKVRHLAGMTGAVGIGAKHRGTGDIVAEPMSPSEKARMWWYNASCGGGALLDMCCYGSMTSDWLAGEPAQGVQAMQGNFNSRWGSADDNACMLVRFPNSIAVLEGTWTAPALSIEPGPEIFATEGVIRCERRGTSAVVKVMDIYGKEEHLEPYPENPNLKNIAYAYAHHKATGAPMPHMTLLENNIRVIAMLDAGIRSVRSGDYETVDNAAWCKQKP